MSLANINFYGQAGYRIGALLFRLFFAALFLFAAINSTSAGISMLANDLARVSHFSALTQHELMNYAYFFVLGALFTTGGLLLIFCRLVPHVYLVACGLYFTFTVWQITTGTSPATADQYIPTLFGLFVAILVESKSARSIRNIPLLANPDLALPPVDEREM